MNFLLGVNYWGRDFATDMWRRYDGTRIREELKFLGEYGVKAMRVFPNWRDFQPVDRAYAWRGQHGEYINVNTGMPVYDDGVDMQMIANFHDFCQAAEENGLQLVVSIVTGWMSGKLFTPPVLNGKNLICDAEALMWMRRYICRFVKELKNEKSIIAWDLGNECNCLGEATTHAEAYNWTSTVTDAIRSVDTSRPVFSGMHTLGSGFDMGPWHIEDQGELCDVLTTHPYPSPTVGGDVEPYNRLRMTLLPTAQSLYYAGVSKKPAYIQESGTFSDAIGSKKMSADFVRIQILSSLANGLCGYQWWCAWEQNHLEFPPYSWAMVERELGLFNQDGSPKPVAFVMKEMSSLLDKLPSPFPARISDAVCVLTRGINRQSTAISSIILGKQAGIDIDVVYTETGDVPEASIYFVPSMYGWQVIYRKTWDTLLERAKNGATLFLSTLGGHMTAFNETVGAESMGMIVGNNHTFELDGKTESYTGKEILLNPTTAEVIYKNEAGNPVLLKNKYGKGYIYFCNFSPEQVAFDTPDGYNTHDYYKLYKLAAAEVINNKIIRTDNSNLGVTVNPENDSTCLVTVLNLSDKEIVPSVTIKDGWKIKEIIYGDLSSIPACNGVILRLVKA